MEAGSLTRRRSGHKDMPLLMLCPQVSPRARGLVLLGQVLLLGAMWLADLPWAVALGGSMALLGFGWVAWHRPQTLRCVQWGRDGVWQLQLSDGVWVGARLNAAASRAWPWWVYLAFRLEDGRRLGVIFFADAVSADAFRRLRVRLKVDASAHREIVQ